MKEANLPEKKEHPPLTKEAFERLLTKASHPSTEKTSE